MLSNIQKNIILRAVEIRRNAGEEPEAILESYPKLTAEDRAELLAAYNTQ